MRLPHALACTLGALALTTALAAPAHAATGDFSYTFTGESGEPQSSTLNDPASNECLNLPEVEDPATSEPAYAPHNDTDAYAMVFTGADCSGDNWTLRPHGKPASDRLKLRSVVFVSR